MKNLQRSIIILILCIIIAPMAMAQETNALTCAANALNPDSFAHYAAYTHHTDTGLWRVHAYPADALLDQLWEYGENNSNPISAFHLELEGNTHTGVLTPIFRFYYVDGKKPINATAVSFLIDGIRYDLAAASTGKFSYGRESAEIISAPLTREAMAVISALLDGENITVRLMGDQIYTMELDHTTLGRKAIQNASLKTLASDFALLQQANISEYALWDLTYSAWKAMYGFSPAFAVNEVIAAIGEESITDAFGMILPGAEGKAAYTAQEILIDYGFLGGSASNTFLPNASAAVRRAQKYLGMIITGCMDAQLERALTTTPVQDTEESHALYSLGTAAKIALDRYWFAAGAGSTDGSDVRTVVNKNHSMLIADGTIQNISPNTMHLFMQMEARIIYDGSYAYEATILCEQNNGSKLDTMLLPMDQARLIVYAEIPSHLTAAPADKWQIELSINGDALKFSLK